MDKTSKILGSVIVTSAGGPAAENVIQNFRIGCLPSLLVGIDADELMLNLSSAPIRQVIPKATNPDYPLSINSIAKRVKASMLYPQSDIEVFICSEFRNILPPMVLPDQEVIRLCQDKGKLYTFFAENGIEVPEFKLPTKRDIRMLLLNESPNYGIGVSIEDIGKPTEHSKTWESRFPLWVRSRKGAGGKAAFKANTWHDLRNMIEYWKDKEEIDWMMIKYLGGRDYSWTSLWQDGKLLTSVLKERLRWLYNRIGTTAAQVTVTNDTVNKYCEKVIRTIDDKITGIMMVDLKEDLDEQKFYITEINAGRLGTVNYFYGYASDYFYGDVRVNFPMLLWYICHGITLPHLKKFNAIPIGTYWLRHIDMSSIMIPPQTL
jgi:carbamoyl-phosphate synthase large subunit